MPPLLSSLTARLTLADPLSLRAVTRVAPAAVFHLAALAVMLWSEIGVARMAVFVFAWGLLNCLWLVLLRRPALSAALSFAILATLIAVSRFKFQVLWMTASFVDVMIIDTDTIAFLWMMFPQVRTAAIIALVLTVPLTILLWKIDPLRVRRRVAFVGAAGCLAAITGLSMNDPVAHGEAFGDENYVSHFARSGVEAVAAYASQGFLESDAEVVDRLKLVTDDTCQAAGKRPHIILVHDESKCRRATAAISAPMTARPASSWSKAPAVRAGTPNTTCCRGCRRALMGGSSSS
jgi:phosphoglycerol transferase MdoB-like AlkP superfamily enzyme